MDMETEARRRGRRPKAPEAKCLKVSLSLSPALITALQQEVEQSRARSISEAASLLMWRGLKMDVK